jgi:diguanylate cyclase (GGDEF)-like protein
MRTAHIDPLQGDQLSGLMSRAAFFAEATAACWHRGDPGLLSVVMVDIDSFKAINEHYGHLVGDRAIEAVADVVRRCGAPAGRLGSDEFGILLKGQTLAEAVKFAEDLHGTLGDLTLETDEWTVQVTCSLGVGEFQKGDTVDDLMKRADLALYRARHEGRDRVATTPSDSWMSQRPRLGVSLARWLSRPSPEVKDRRKGAPPGDALYARVFAVIDLLIASGLSEEIAARILTERLSLAGASPPELPEGATWWQDILDRRAAFRTGDATEQNLQEYRNVVAAIETIAPHERVECALANDLWDRRRMDASRRPEVKSLLIP